MPRRGDAGAPPREGHRGREERGEEAGHADAQRGVGAHRLGRRDVRPEREVQRCVEADRDGVVQRRRERPACREGFQPEADRVQQVGHREDAERPDEQPVPVEVAVEHGRRPRREEVRARDGQAGADVRRLPRRRHERLRLDDAQEAEAVHEVDAEHQHQQRPERQRPDGHRTVPAEPPDCEGPVLVLGDEPVDDGQPARRQRREDGHGRQHGDGQHEAEPPDVPLRRVDRGDGERQARDGPTDRAAVGDGHEVDGEGERHRQPGSDGQRTARDPRRERRRGCDVRRGRGQEDLEDDDGKQQLELRVQVGAPAAAVEQDADRDGDGHRQDRERGHRAGGRAPRQPDQPGAEVQQAELDEGDVVVVPAGHQRDEQPVARDRRPLPPPDVRDQLHGRMGSRLRG